MDVPPEIHDAVLASCPACDAPVNVDASAYAGELPCPGCGNHLWLLRTKAQGAIVLTFLPWRPGCEASRRVEEAIQTSDDLSRVVADLSRLRFISSPLLGILIMLHRKVNAVQGSLKLCGLHPNIEEVLKVTRLNTLFSICDDRQSAFSSFGTSARNQT